MIRVGYTYSAMWILFLVVVCCFGSSEGGCPSRDGEVEEGHVTTFGCLSCTCGADDMYTCSYPTCNLTVSVNPCYQYPDGDDCCARCEEYGCVNQYADGEIVPVGDVFFPNDPCFTCMCTLGHRDVICTAVMCQRPTCRNYRRRPGTCCEYDCPDGSTSGAARRDRPLGGQEVDHHLTEG